tara:strand:- start:102 stop:629 length:528 start_codon:yes stop_codon:yes gene_type:complete
MYKLISTTNISDGVTFVSIEGCFTSDYDVYLVNGVDFENNTSSAGIDFRFLDESNGEITDSTYQAGKLSIFSYAANAASSQANANYIDRIADMESFTTGLPATIQMYVFNPYSNSDYTNATLEGNSTNGTNHITTKSFVSLNQDTRVTGMKFYLDNTSSRSFKSGTIDVYGLEIV